MCTAADLQPELNFLSDAFSWFILLGLILKISDFDFECVGVDSLLESNEKLQIPHSKLLLQFLQLKV